MLVLSNLRSPDTGRGKREKPNDWLGPQNGSGDPFPSAEVNSKKRSFWAGFVAGGRTIAILLRVEDKRITETRRIPGSSSQCKKIEQSLLARERRKDSPVEPRRKKYKISNFGAIFLYTQISFTTLSLSIWRKIKVKKRHLYSWTVQLLYVLTPWKVYITVVKEFMYFYVTMWSMLLFHASFQLLFALCYLA